MFYRKPKFILITVLFLGFLFVINWLPKLVTAMLIVNLGLIVLHGCLQIWLALKKPSVNKKRKGHSNPFVSIHIPVCNEPPKMVIQTIQACLNLEYENFEIIVLDNNSESSKSWLPVEQFCRSREKVTFLQKNNVKGFKAGALDICRLQSHEETEFIFTVDADYLIQPDALSVALQYMNDKETAVVQFPQSYRNVSGNHTGICNEFHHYFQIYSNGSNRYKTSLATGTLTFLRVSALDKAGGWKTNSITEDAALGLKLKKLGFHLLYVDEIIGKGLLPNRIHDLKKQRNRWVFGNMQALAGLIGQKQIPVREQLMIFLQLTAWINFLGIPLLIMGNVIVSLLFMGFPQPALLLVLSLNFIIYLVTKFLLFGLCSKFEWKCWFSSFQTHLTYVSIGAFDWWTVFIGEKKPFVRTNKYALNHLTTKVPWKLQALFLGLAVALFVNGFPLHGIIVSFFFLLFTLSGFSLLQQVRETVQTDYLS